MNGWVVMWGLASLIFLFVGALEWKDVVSSTICLGIGLVLAILSVVAMLQT